MADPAHPSPDTPPDAPALIARARQFLPGPMASLDRISRILGGAGHRMVLVGGAVRNLVLGTAPSDLDLASDATPEDVIRLFRHVIPTGMAHGTVTIRMDHQGFEITTFRVDGAYTDSRRPDSVSFTRDLEEDLRRRDFTVNAMALDLERRVLVDPHGGHRDLQDRIIRTVGLAEERFREDPLRIVRGVRFACQLGFRIDPATRSAMAALGPTLAGVSVERFVVELRKTLASPRGPEGVEIMKECGMLEAFLPGTAGLAPAEWQALVHRLRISAALEDTPGSTREDRAMALLLNPRGDPDCDAPKRLKLSRKDMDRTLQAGRNARNAHRWDPHGWRVFLSLAGHGEETFHLDAGLLYGMTGDSDSDTARTMQKALHQALGTALSSPCPRSVSALAIGGRDLADMGIPPSARTGEILRTLFGEVLEDPGRNRKEWLLERARTLRDAPDPAPGSA